MSVFKPAKVTDRRTMKAGARIFVQTEDSSYQGGQIKLKLEKMDFSIISQEVIF